MTMILLDAGPRFFARLCAAATACVAGALMCSTASAQAVSINQSGDNSLTAINSGQVTLSGHVINPTATGSSNSAGALSAQGASSTYSITDTNLNASGDPAGITYQASVSGAKFSGDNSGSVTTNGRVIGGMMSGDNSSQSIAATGMSNTISIKTTGK